MNTTLKQMASTARAYLKEGEQRGYGYVFSRFYEIFPEMIRIKAEELNAPYTDIEKVFWKRVALKRHGHTDVDNAYAYVGAMEDIARLERKVPVAP